MAGRQNASGITQYPRIRDQGPTLGALAAVALGYCIAGRVSLFLAVPPGYATAIWPAAGIALGAVLIYGPRIWPAVFAGSFAINLWISFDSVANGSLNAVAAAALIACGASVQAVWSAWLLRRLNAWPSTMETGASVMRLLLIGGPLGCLINACIGVGSLLATGLIQPGESGFNWLNWWVGDAIGVVVVTPLMLVWSGAMGDFWRRRALAVSLSPAVALTVVVVSFFVATDREQARIENAFHDTTRHIESAIVTRMNAVIEVLGALQSHHASSETVEAHQFRVFTERALSVNRDLLALSFNPYVTHEQRSSYENPVGKGMPLRFTERNAEGQLVRAAPRDDYVVVQYIEPLEENRGAVGFNVSSNPVRHAAIERARDSGQPAATGRVHLVQADRSEPGLLIFAPVYSSVTTPESVEERRGHIAGYFVGVMLVRHFLASATSGLPLDNLAIHLYDESAAAQRKLLASANNDIDGDPIMSASHRVPFAGRTWQLRIDAGAAYVAAHRAPGLGMVLGIGLLLSGLLGAFNLTLAGNERREALRAAQDPLTGLANRGEFERRLDHALARCRDQASSHTLAYCDLDKFKLINDTAGHQAGDELLRQIASLLQANLRARDTVGRLGGDEFALLLENCPVDKGAEIARQICADVRGFEFNWQGQIFQVGASIGVIELDAEAGGTEDVLSRADVACYTAKDLGRNRVHVDCVDNPLVRRRQTELQRVSELRATLDQNGLMLYGQPIWAIEELGKVPSAYEVLLRLRGPDGEALPPGGSIAVAERYGIMTDVDRWVIRHALQRGRRLCARGAILSLNLSANSLDEESLADFIAIELKSSGIAPDSVCFEITETAAITNLDAAVRFMQRMRKLGCRFALDDFGAGISSFRYLRTLPVDWLKIEGSLVQGIATDETAHAMVAAIQQIAQALDIATVAEWVCDEEVLAVLRQIGVRYAQGFALGRPVLLDSIETRVAEAIAG